ncbi:uncharacterized protein LOC143913982 [Arctopsyche grandis]|uniref:uncharacterized protein LOC143913982 n=1 Tax=Arctopsyche grandis TaxID=121162 RepID=UPI00406DA3F3
MSSAENEEIEASTSKSHKGRNPTRDVEPIRDRSSSRIHQTRSQTQSIEILAKENKVEVIMTSIELRYSGAVQRLKGKIDKSSELDEGQYQTIKEAYDYVRKLHYEYLDNLTDIPKAAKIDEEYDAITITVKNLKAALDCQSFQDSKLKVEQATIKFARDKLPTLTIPTFQGDPSEWQSFQQAFKNIIGNKTEYSNVTKLQYLHQSLIGPALAAVSGLDISSDNYEIAWSILDKQYNLPRLNLKTRINSLCDLKLITRESHIELRNLLNQVTVCIKNIESLGYAREILDPWVTCLVLRKLPFNIVRDWEISLVSREMPPYESLETFLQNRCNVLQSTASVTTVKEFPHSRQRIMRTHVANKNPSSKVNACAFCRNNHFIGKCDKFKAKSSMERNEFVKSNNMCFKCLNSSHKITNCKSNYNCLRCKQNHHTLLHQDDTFSSNNTGRKSINAHSTHFSQRERILPTVQVDIITSNGTVVKGRTLLDSGSQVNYVTTSFAKKNNFKLEKISQKIVGIANQESSIRHITKVTIRSSTTNYSTKVLCLVLPEITGEIPTVKLDQQLISIPAGIKLSDPLWNKPTPIDLLLGAEICVHAMKAGTIQLGKGMPILKDTEFGWTIVGPYPEVNNAPGKSHIGLSQLDSHIQNFWMIDQVPMVKHQSLEEKRCEEHFQAHTSRDKNGRFCVALPYKNSPVVLGSSLHIAEKRHKTLERRFLANNNLKMEYNKVLEEYINLGHMSECEPPEAHEVHCYLPHHVVVKESSLTTKYRVVFDASAKTTSNISLNNILMVGPNVQSDLLSLLLNFRLHKYVITADIKQMYRQIQIAEKNKNVQRIIWRTDPQSKFKHYKLNTVTFGTASAPFLATRCLNQLAEENRNKYPIASKVIERDFYVDDLLTGTNTIEAGKLLKVQLETILLSAGMPLSKWTSNNSDIITDVKADDCSDFNFSNESHKTLGLFWKPREDVFVFKVQTEVETENITKRNFLSVISQIFDPLGLLSPLLINYKILMQSVWQQTIGWDEFIPQTIFKKWKDCQLSNTVMKLYKIPRLIILNNVINIQAHGFCDASEKAYGACIYVKCTDQLGNSKCHLVCSRSRVAPLSFVTIPRLELCSAMLLSKLMKSTIDQLTIHINEKYYWTDSTVALHWIRGESCKWTTFVANRVAEIQSISQPIEWYHVSSTDNPADLISRGTQPSELNHNSLWWDGPSWLKLDESRWPRRPPEITIDLPERRVVTNATLVRENNWIDKHSHLPRLLRVLSYVRRPLRNKQLNVKENNEPSALELKDALNNLIRLSQMESFPLEYRLLSKGHPIPSSSKLAKLSPLFHENLICVGSRLPLGTTLSTSPIILSNKHKLTHMIVRDAHLKYIHLGTQALLSLLRQTYWPLAGHNTVKGVVRSCVICFRNKPLSHNRLMGLLPLERTTANFPFSHVGIDFAGPFPVKSGCNKNSKIIKGYVCVFVCFSSKAVHLELVGDLTSSNFLNCLRRFVARRGRPNTIYSDNATNFVGASRELVNLVKLIYERPHEEKLLRYVASEGIRWKFNPPRAPHMGGLWEAAVKSMKIHLNKVLKATTLNFESFCTVLTQIEACMNSRPLSPLSSDPLDLLPLTPGHFLIGRSLLALPMEVKYNTNVHANLLQIQLTTAAFWKRWSAEYLHSLQLRHKWKKDSSNNLSVGQMVLLKEEHMLPTRWVLGRVTKLYPGPDGRVRVVDVFTASGEFRRSSHLVAPLPILPQGPLDRKEDQQEGGETAASIPSTSVA